MPKYKKQEKQLYYAHFFHQIFQVSFHLVWCEDGFRARQLVELNANRVLNFPQENGAECLFIYSKEGRLTPTIIFPHKWNNSPEQISLLSHECGHAIMAMFRYKSLPLPKDSENVNDADEENYLYNHQWLFQECLYAMKEQNKYKFKLEGELEIKK